LELIEWVSIEGKIEESFRIIAGVDAMVNELVEQRRFPNTTPSNKTEKRLILELAAGLVGPGQMVEVTLLSCWEGECLCSLFPPRIMVVKRPDESVTSVDRHGLVD